MGGWCGAQGADITTRKTGVRLRLQIWGVPGGTQQAKSCQKLWKGEVLPLDRSLLMGGLSLVGFPPTEHASLSWTHNRS